MSTVENGPITGSGGSFVRKAIVTGGASRIGGAITSALLKEGYEVFATYRSHRERVEALGVRAEPFDLADPESAAALLERTGSVDVLVHNAFAWSDPAVDWRPAVRANVEGMLDLVGACLPGMTGAGWGRVVLLSSAVVHAGIPGLAGYAAAKGAVHAAARSLSWDGGPAGVTVNVVVPGLIASERTEAAAGDFADHVADVASRTPLGRLATADEVAAAVLFFCSEQASGVTGQELFVDGGKD
ncbi:MAG TPA: SDR family oxidoreductase [Umezawaea sp.]|nr:SDR family oxidoreductase [Umezawaea sp.]